MKVVPTRKKFEKHWPVGRVTPHKIVVAGRPSRGLCLTELARKLVHMKWLCPIKLACELAHLEGCA